MSYEALLELANMRVNIVQAAAERRPILGLLLRYTDAVAAAEQARHQARFEQPYPWLDVLEDGGYAADVENTTPAEMDRRLVIVQELSAGRLQLPPRELGDGGLETLKPGADRE